MARPKGSASRPDAKRPGGAPTHNQNAATFGHRKAEVQLRRGETLTGLAAMDRREIERVYRASGARRLKEDLMLDHLAVLERFKALLDHVATQKEKGDTYNLYARTWDRLASTAFGMLDKLELSEASTLDYEQILEARKRD